MMQKSIIERVFPKPKKPLLPQYDKNALQYRDDDSTSQTNISNRIRLNSNASTTLSSGRRSSESRSPLEGRSHVSLQPAPLSASIVHHDDPFIAVDRAASNLQQTIQSLLDFQSDALTDRISNGQDDNASQTSTTPTQSVSISSTKSPYRLRTAGVVPVRQPTKKRLTLKAARQGIGRSMHEFVALKNEELKIAQAEKANRQVSLDRISDFEAKREAVNHELGLLRDNANDDQYLALSDECDDVGKRIKDLEDQLMELKARHRHLLERKAQKENASASQLSSYQGTLAGIDKEIRHFLRHPPVKQGLSPRDLLTREDTAREQDLYALRPERRTLQLARGQWSQEIEVLDDHEADIRKETQALLKGAETWQLAVTRIDEFESLLRRSLKSSGLSPAADVLPSLDATLIFLQKTLSEAEMKDWTLLVCAIGAELEAFKEARRLLAPDEPLPEVPASRSSIEDTKLVNPDNDDILHTDLLDTQLRNTHSEGYSTFDTISSLTKGKAVERITSPLSSNESLKATLNAISSATLPANGMSDSRQFRPRPTQSISARSIVAANPHSESEDDDPGPDFLVSHDS